VVCPCREICKVDRKIGVAINHQNVVICAAARGIGDRAARAEGFGFNRIADRGPAPRCSEMAGDGVRAVADRQDQIRHPSLHQSLDQIFQEGSPGDWRHGLWQVLNVRTQPRPCSAGENDRLHLPSSDE